MNSLTGAQRSCAKRSLNDSVLLFPEKYDPLSEIFCSRGREALLVKKKKKKKRETRPSYYLSSKRDWTGSSPGRTESGESMAKRMQEEPTAHTPERTPTFRCGSNRETHGMHRVEPWFTWEMNVLSRMEHAPNIYPAYTREGRSAPLTESDASTLDSFMGSRQNLLRANVELRRSFVCPTSLYPCSRLLPLFSSFSQQFQNLSNFPQLNRVRIESSFAFLISLLLLCFSSFRSLFFRARFFPRFV